MKKNKHSLTDLRVTSFVTVLDKEQQNSVTGGYVRIRSPYNIIKWTVLETRGEYNPTDPKTSKSTSIKKR
ncbi:MAG: pinensin family lanthipeptide [Saprospiraceae bacterium]|nr:pinensin family lanthipeptide [Saprospiraceae bacterium]MBP7680223.1 pinensin family lanthipeptide [Saprospiraceae bacterium]